LYSDGPAADWAFDHELAPDRDQIIRSCLQTPEAFLISGHRSERARKGSGRLAPPADVIRNGEGLVVPIYHADQPVAAAGFWGPGPDTSPLTRALLQIVSHAAAERSDALKGSRRSASTALTAREAQCLGQVACGHPDAEIGRQLGISARTVRFHIDSAKTKLGAATRIQAVAKALRERIIAV
jgi:LuxR family quorum sensing-dependent transcriptional regulator